LDYADHGYIDDSAPSLASKVPQSHSRG